MYLYTIIYLTQAETIKTRRIYDVQFHSKLVNQHGSVHRRYTKINICHVVAIRELYKV